MIELHCPGWSSGPVVEAVSFWGRFRGIRSIDSPWGLLLRVRSIHTFGLDGMLGVVALSPERTVLAAFWVRPRRVLSVDSAVEYLEVRPGRPLPPVGARLESTPIVTR